MSILGFVFILFIGILIGINIQFGLETLIDVIRGRKELKILRQQIAETQAEQLKEVESTTV